MLYWFSATNANPMENTLYSEHYQLPFLVFPLLNHACLYKNISTKCVSLLKIVSRHANSHLSCGNACADEFAMTFECDAS